MAGTEFDLAKLSLGDVIPKKSIQGYRMDALTLRLKENQEKSLTPVFAWDLSALLDDLVIRISLDERCLDVKESKSLMKSIFKLWTFSNNFTIETHSGSSFKELY